MAACEETYVLYRTCQTQIQKQCMDSRRTDEHRENPQRLAIGLHDILFGNHSCDPSVTVAIQCIAGGYTNCGIVTFTVIRDITPGEEITFTYLHQDDMNKTTAERKHQLRTR